MKLNLNNKLRITLIFTGAFFASRAFLGYIFGVAKLNKENVMDFQDKVQTLINQYSIENESDTPDFILAQYLQDCLDTWEKTVRARDKRVEKYNV